MKIRIAITDDHPMVVSGLKNMLAHYTHLEIAATFTSGQALLDGLLIHSFDVLLLDINLPDKKGTELIVTLRKKYPLMKIIAVTSMEDVYYIKKMMSNGCAGYLLKKSDEDTLVQAIEEVYKGNEFLEPELKTLLLNEVLKKPLEPSEVHITKREKEILQLIVAQYSNKEIAEKLYLSENTVKNHRFSLQHKLQVKNSIGLVAKAQELGLIH